MAKRRRRRARKRGTGILPALIRFTGGFAVGFLRGMWHGSKQG